MQLFRRLALLLALLAWVGLPILAEVHTPETGGARNGESLLSALMEIPQTPILLPGEEPSSTEETSDPGMAPSGAVVRFHSVSLLSAGQTARLRPARSADLILLLTRRNE